VALIYMVAGIVALIYGAVAGWEAAEKAEGRAEERQRKAEEKAEREREDRKTYMEKFGVAPDPDVVAPTGSVTRERSNG
jgi:hypothetical protein